MSRRDELAAIARRWIALWCVPVDWDAFAGLHAEHFEDCSSAGRPATREGFARGLAELLVAFPDLHTTAEDLVIDEARSRVAVRWAATGTNRASYMGIGPTLRVTPITGIEIIEIERGQIVRRWGEWDITAHRAEAP